jgi:imidazolonepropionase
MKADLLLHDVRIVTMVRGRYGLIQRGAIAISGAHIAWVGELAALPNVDARKRIAGRGQLVTPGLIDCHTHLIYAGNRTAEFEERLQGATYEEIAQRGGGIMSTVLATRRASPEALAAMARPRLRALLSEGVTTVEIKTGYGLQLDAEVRMLEAMAMLAEDHPVEIFRTFLAAHAIPTEYRRRPDEYVDQIVHTMLPHIAELPPEVRPDAVDAYCEGIAFSVEQTRRIFEAAREHGFPLKVHAEQLSNLGGAALAAGLNALSADHLEYLDALDIPVMMRAGTVAVLLPCALYYLREGRRPPVDLLRRRAIPIAIATDANPGTSPCFSLLTAMNMACILLGLTPEEALAGVTLHAARALGRANRLGTIEPGKQADLVLWDVETPAELSYYLGYTPKHRVIKRGVVLS